MIFNMAGGGTSLNFGVVAYATEAALLAATPKENTIGIITTTPIPGWSFSATEPAEPAEGLVWIKVGEYSSVAFNALKKNTLNIYPLTAKQYTNGAWAERSAQIYQEGRWTAWWGGQLYENGNQWEDITGGWKSVNNTGLKTVFESDRIVIKSGSGETFEATVYTNNKIDVTGFNNLTAEISNIAFPSSWSGQGVYVGLTSINNDTCPTGKFVASKKHSSKGSATLTADISNISGEYYVAVVADVATCKITEVHLS